MAHLVLASLVSPTFPAAARPDHEEEDHEEAGCSRQKKIKRPAAAPRRAAASGRGDTTEGDENNWTDAETLIMGTPEKARKNMLKKPSAAVGAEASEDVPGSPTLEASEDELTSQWTPIGETC